MGDWIKSLKRGPFFGGAEGPRRVVGERMGHSPESVYKGANRVFSQHNKGAKGVRAVLHAIFVRFLRAFGAAARVKGALLQFILA